METKLFYPQQENTAIAEAAEILRDGGLVGIPTETVYGLGADGLNEDAVRRIFEAKGRPQDNPLILHVPSAAWLERYCENVPQAAYDLAARFWPGPLTMILPRKKCVPLRTTGGLETVGIRCPDHPVTLAIIEAAGVPVAAPSGNTSGRPSPTAMGHMVEDMSGKIDAIVEGGPCRVGVESTIVDLTVTPPRLLRPGGLALEALEAVLGEVQVDKAVREKLAEGEKPRAPGMKYRHYAPKAAVTVVTGSPQRSAAWILGRVKPGDGVLCFDEFAPLFGSCVVQTLGSAGDKAQQARRVFDALRAFDETNAPCIYAQCPNEEGLGLAIGNRLKKAAGFCVEDAGSGLIFGLTGGTGAGKTSALRALERLGGYILDCDALYHEMLRGDAPMKKAITDAFGEVFLPDGTLDRQKLGNVVFRDPEAMARLNAIVYAHLVPEAARRAQGHEIVGFDAINVIESGMSLLCCRTVGVIAPAQLRVQRIMARDGIDEHYARMRIAAQKSDAFYYEHCTDVLENTEKSPAAFEEKALAFFTQLIKEEKLK